MKYSFLLTLLISSVAFATETKLTDVNLTEACEETVKKEALEKEMAVVSKKGMILASKLEATVSLYYWPAKDDATVGVKLIDPVDGRSVSYSATVLKTEAEKCNIPLQRKDKSACRYSTSDGPDGLNSIPGVKFEPGKTIKANDPLYFFEEKQIRVFLDERSPGASVTDLIKSTDDKELSTGKVTLPPGEILTYYGAYAGDNPIGMFFINEGENIAGTNGDGFVCIVPFSGLNP